MATERFPDALDPEAVGSYDVVAGTGGGYVWDAVLEYRVWCHPEDGRDDFFYAFPSHAEALRFANRKRASDATVAKVEEPLALVLQDEYIEESGPGEYAHVTERRITEWPPGFSLGRDATSTPSRTSLPPTHLRIGWTFCEESSTTPENRP